VHIGGKQEVPSMIRLLGAFQQFTLHRSLHQKVCLRSADKDESLANSGEKCFTLKSVGKL